MIGTDPKPDIRLPVIEKAVNDSRRVDGWLLRQGIWNVGLPARDQHIEARVIAPQARHERQGTVRRRAGTQMDPQKLALGARQTGAAKRLLKPLGALDSTKRQAPARRQGRAQGRRPVQGHRDAMHHARRQIPSSSVGDAAVSSSRNLWIWAMK